MLRLLCRAVALDVIGPGFGRTGTMSCKAALEQLGFGPCYHMLEVYERGHIDAWTRAINGEEPDWDTLFRGYRAAVDWPACSFWKQLLALNPGAKVVLTRRDPDAWFDSMRQTIFQALRADSDDPERMRWRVQTRRLIFEKTFANRFDRESVIAVLKAHEADVVASVAPADLLVFDVADGWEPLCGFLGVPVPDTPFPRSNSTAEFRVWTGLDPAP
jgi:hypothetical protein